MRDKKDSLLSLKKINFIDGSALTPSDFGETDSATGVWKPKAYSGTYGTNGFYLPFKTANNWSGYFDGSGDYLTAPSVTGTTLDGDFTIEYFMYRPSAGNNWIFTLGDAFLSSGIETYIGSSGTAFNLWINGASRVSSSTLPTVGAWSHVAVVRSGTTITFYLNGISLGTYSSSATFSGITYIGAERYNSSITGVFTGWLSNFRIVKGTAVYTSSFTPPTAQLTAITNTQLLTCQSSTFVDNSTNGLTITAVGDSRPQQFSPFTLDVTDDHSGTGNNWQPNNLDLRTTGVGADILVDSPTSYGTDTGVGGTVRGNYCTLNPLDNGNSNILLTNGNLSVSSSTTWDRGVKATVGISSGKWYYEYTHGTVNAGTNPAADIGWTKYTSLVNSYSNGGGGSSDTYLVQGSNGNKNNGGTNTSYGSAFTTGDIEMCALDLDNGKMYWGKNGTWFASGDPAAGTNAAYTGLSGTFFPLWYWGISPGTSGVLISNINFGQRAFAYTAPSGFKALCTTNLPTPTIGATSTTQANDYFNTVLYTGDYTTSHPITGVGFQPDLVWIKDRGLATVYNYSHLLYDAVRGAGKELRSNATDAEADRGTGTTSPFRSFDSDGFTVGQNYSSNEVDPTAEAFVAWNWNAGGSNATNTSGTITSTVRANTTSGFSVVTASASGTSPVTVGHGLGVAPSMVIGRVRNNTANWYVYHSSFSAQDYLVLNSTAAKATSSNIWDVAPTSTVFTIGNPQNGWNGGTAGSYNYVAYCFAPVAGYSAFGSYTGNGSADGPFVYTGFRPRFVLMKYTNTTSYWIIFDTARNTYNLVTAGLRPNDSAAENTNLFAIDVLSNGFKVRDGGGLNGSGDTTIYAAFAEFPFKFSLAR